MPAAGHDRCGRAVELGILREGVAGCRIGHASVEEECIPKGLGSGESVGESYLNLARKDRLAVA